jgi:hypothetical protein
MTVQILRWQFTVADFARMTEAVSFAEDDRVELIDGAVRAISPIGPRHAAIVKLCHSASKSASSQIMQFSKAIKLRSELNGTS